jgi:hypothetical protein
VQSITVSQPFLKRSSGVFTSFWAPLGPLKPESIVVRGSAYIKFIIKIGDKYLVKVLQATILQSAGDDCLLIRGCELRASWRALID